jgi:hypothetical protein
MAFSISSLGLNLFLAAILIFRCFQFPLDIFPETAGTRNSPDMLVLACVHVALELFSGGPKSGLKTKG